MPSFQHTFEFVSKFQTFSFVMTLTPEYECNSALGCDGLCFQTILNQIESNQIKSNQIKFFKKIQIITEFTLV